MKRRVLMLAFSVMLLSCSLLDSFLDPQETPTNVPEGLLQEFYCTGHEFGLLAFAGTLTLRQDGSVGLKWGYGGATLEGTWDYDSVDARVTFSSDLEISYGGYDDGAGILTVYLREGVERAHVETGVMWCER
jgi:hypothetical protein